MVRSRVLCLANSPKENARCIAGIDLTTGRLVRPIAEKSNAIPNDWSILGGKEIKPLDVLEIPFMRGDAVVPFQSENRYCSDGWMQTGKYVIEETFRFYESDNSLSCTCDSDAITERAMKLKPFGRAGWKSLQLIRVRNVLFEKEHNN